MTRFEDLPRGKRRRLVAKSLLRATASAALLVVAYYLLPFDHISALRSELIVAFGLFGVAVLVGWQVRAIVRADYPMIQAINALATTIPLFVLIFSSTYYLMSHAKPFTFTQHLTRTDALYFTVVTFSTVGYGDITAKSETARLLVTLQILADLVIIGFGVRVLLAAVQRSQRRHAETREASQEQTV